jgi:sodium/bile acid cotransporter 7
MLPFLRKHWFLLLILIGTVAVAFYPEWMGWTGWLDPTVCGTAAVFFSAWTLETRSLGAALARPWPAVWAVIISYGLLPMLGIVGGWLLPDIPDYQIGMLLITSVPCTLVSAVIWTRLAKGDDATALLIIFIANCTSWLATTAWLTLAVGTSGHALNAGPVMLTLVVVLVVPVGVGQMLRIPSFLRHTATKYRIMIGVAARLLTVAVMLKAAVEVRISFSQDQPVPGLATLATTAIVCLAVHLIALAAGWWSSKALGFDRPRRIAVAFGGSQKTLPISLILFDAYFRDKPLAVIPIVFYHFGQLIADTFIAEHLAGVSQQRHDEHKAENKEDAGLMP